MKNFKLALMSVIACVAATQANAGFKDYATTAQQRLSAFTLDTAHWYVAGNIGVSHLYDDEATGSGRSVDESGPGWDADLGYQFNSMFGSEVGYTQYYNSRETSGSTVVAKTTHFAVHANATGRYPIADKLSVLGKLGVAYSYAQKVFEATGAAGSSGSVSPFMGLGLDYSITPNVDMVGQWGFVRGNDYTGSSTLYSVGLVFGIA